jgi:hypothetical protein
MVMMIVEQNNMKSGNGNYPIGAQYDPNAPWNKPELKEQEIDVTISITLSKTTKITVHTLDDTDHLDSNYLKECVESLVCLPHEIKYISMLPDVIIPSKIIEDFDNWVVDDFEVIQE